MKLIKPISKFIDHTILKHNVAQHEFIKVLQECKEHDFAMIAINSEKVIFCKSFLKDTDVHVGAAIGFPLGQTTTKVKAFETEQAISEGADEIDYVINLCDVKDEKFENVKKEMETIVSICRKHHVISKVIFENCYLTREEIIKLCEIASIVKPDYIKTSTGFGEYGARIEDVELMRKYTSLDVQIKAAGGIRDLETALAMIEAGATRIGTSAGVKIVTEYLSHHG
jgi:deoxyribose-phosphate aldolase